MMASSASILRHRLLVALSASLLACGGKDTPGTGETQGGGGVSGSSGQGGGGGGAGPGCLDESQVPRKPDGTIDCGPGSPGVTCDLACYQPGVAGAPSACLEPDDPELAQVNINYPSCGGPRPLGSGPYCVGSASPGSTPQCCYVVGFSGCIGRPLMVDDAGRVAPLRRGGW